MPGLHLQKYLRLSDFDGLSGQLYMLQGVRYGILCSECQHVSIKRREPNKYFFSVYSKCCEKFAAERHYPEEQGLKLMQPAASKLVAAELRGTIQKNKD